MTDFLTTRQLQAILHVDRTTLYRMAESGRVPATKVGHQWRYPRQQIEAWLKIRSPVGTPEVARQSGTDAGQTTQLAELLPMECVQRIQDAFADALGVMILLSDMNGRLVSRPSQLCGVLAVLKSTARVEQCMGELLLRLAQQPDLTPHFVAGPLGTRCASGLVRVGSELHAMVVLCGFAAEKWPPGAEELAAMAHQLGLSVAALREAVAGTTPLDPAREGQLLGMIQRIADIFAHIATERKQLMHKLEQIAALSRA